MKSSMTELVYLLKAKAPCIWIKTYEEEQVVKDIKKIIFNNFAKLKLFSWSYYAGLQEETLTDAEKKKDPENLSPSMLLDRILENELTGEVVTKNVNGKLVKDYKNKNENLWILKDFHLCNETKDILRGIRDVKERDDIIGYNPIVVISPIVNIPLEHEKLFTIIDYETPNTDEISKIINSFVNQLKKIPDKYIVPSENQITNCINLANGLTLNEIKNYAQRSLVKYNTISEDIFYQARLDLIKKTGILEYKECNTSIEEMGGNESFKAWLTDIKETFDPGAEAFGIKKSKGYLAVGIPGTSKTLSAEIIAHELKLPLLQLKMSSIMHSHVGQSEKNMDNALNVVKACSPCVLLIDEIEKTLSGM